MNSTTQDGDNARHFDAGNFAAVALAADANDWRTFAALGLIGRTEPAIEGLARFQEPEAKFYSAVASWIAGDEPRALAGLKEIKLPHAANLQALIRKKRIQVLAQLDTGSQWDFVSALPKNGRFAIQNVGFKPSDQPNRPYADVHSFYDRQSPPDFYVTKLVEWHQLPPNLREIPCPTLGHTADYDIHIQTVQPWLQQLDELVVTDPTEWADVSRLVSSPVSTFPKAFGLGQLPALSAAERNTDVFISGTAMHPYHPDKARLLHQILDMRETAVRFINGFLGSADYYQLLSQTKVGFTYVRHPGAMPTRGLESLAMGAAIAVQEGSVLQLFLTENEGLVTYDLAKGNLPTAIRHILANWTEFSQRAQRGAAVVRREFEMARVASQYFRFLTYLAAKPRQPRSASATAGAQPLEQKRSILLKGWIQAPRVNRQVREAGLARWSEQLDAQPAPHKVIDASRELLLEYATAAYQPVARDFSRNFRTPVVIRRELLTQALDLLRAGAQRFPRSLVIRFNWIRAALHFGEQPEVTEALQILRETVQQPAEHWEVDLMEDVFPWDYFSQFFNYRAYFDCCTAGFQDGGGRSVELARLILASLRYYESFYQAKSDSAVASVALDNEFPFYRLQCARRLMAVGQPESDRAAGDHLAELVRSSMLYLQAHDELRVLHEAGRYTHPDWASFEAKVRLARSRVFTANYGVEDWDAIPLRAVEESKSAPHTTPDVTVTRDATEPATASANGSPRILFLPLEIIDWRQSRHVAYPVQFGLEEALRRAGIQVVTRPMVRGLTKAAQESWLRQVKQQLKGERFDQVWIEAVHSEWDEASLAWLRELAPCRVGFVMESLTYDESAYAMMAKLRSRRALVEGRLSALTHVVVADEFDADQINAGGKTKAIWWPQSVPAHCLQTPGPTKDQLTPDARAIFHGQLYGRRQAWLQSGELKQLLVRPDQSPEDAAGWPALFDATNRSFAAALERSGNRDLSVGVFENHSEALRQIRRAAFNCWLEGLRQGRAVVNLPSLFSGYAGRVFEAIAAGRPVVSWEVPNRPRTRTLFADGKEILLYPATQASDLAEHLKHIQRDPDFALEIADRAQRRLRANHTTEHRVQQILQWLADGTQPEFAASANEAGTIPQTSQGPLAPRWVTSIATADDNSAVLELQSTAAEIQRRVGQFGIASETLHHLSNLQPGNPAVEIPRARNAAQEGHWEEFKQAVNSVFEREPDHVGAWSLVAEQLARAENRSQAIEIRRLLHLRTGQSEETSVELALTSLPLRPAPNTSSADSTGLHGLQTWIADRLAVAWTQARRRSTSQKEVVLPATARVGNLSTADEQFRAGDRIRAWQSTIEAIRHRPYHPEAYLLLAQISQAAGRHASARSFGERARAMAPEWKPAKQFVKSLSSRTDRPDPVSVEFPEPPTADQPPRLTVCLITRNEEQFLERCLAAVRDLASQFVVVDTGSHDKTLELARAYGAEIHHFPWVDDFSAARNVALEHATGDWILFLDADEELVATDREAIRRLMTTKSAIAFRLPMIEKDREDEGVSYVPRLFRNAPGLFYVGRVHEQVFTSIEVRRAEWGLENKLGDATLLHYGYMKEIVASRDKGARNLRLLERAVEEMPGEPNLLMNLGLELARDNRLEEGLVRYKEAFDRMSSTPRSQVSPELREALLTQYAMHLFKATDHAEVANVLQSPLARDHGLTATMHWILGLACIESKAYADGADQMRKCIATRDQRALTPIQKNVLGSGPHHCLGLCLAATKRPAEAKKAFTAALNTDPDSRIIRFDFARLLADSGEPVEALKWLHQLMAEDPTDVRVWHLGGFVALSKPDFLEFALDWTGEAIRHHPSNGALIESRATALLLNGQVEEAEPLWTKLPVAQFPSALAATVLCRAILDQPLPAVPSALREKTDGEFLRIYRRLLEYNAAAVIERLNARVDALRRVVPGPARMLEAALAEAAVS